MKSILFVCLGNICRSPLAEALFRRKAEEVGLAFRVDSAGTGSWHIGEPPCANSVRVAALHGLDISRLRARQVGREDLERFDYVVALDGKNAADLKAMGAINVVKLGDYGFGGADVPDPYFFNGFEGFENVFRMIDRCCVELLSEIMNKTM